MKEINLKGMIPAAILPMDEAFEPDYHAFAHYLEWLIGQNAVALAINMDTGEGPQLSIAERRQAAETAVAVANGRVPVLGGVMGATTAGAVAMAQVYQEAGLDGIVPFPNGGFRNDPLDPRIPVAYHQAIADAVDLPMVLFQLAPVFGGVNYSREILLQLLRIPTVVAIKEASFDANYFAYTKETVDLSGRDITLLTGNDRFITESLVMGATGALLGFGAIGCGMIARQIDCFARGDYQQGVAMRPLVQGFGDVIYRDPVLDYRARCKVALAHLGVIAHNRTFVRPPLLSIEEPEYGAIRQAMVQAGMLGQ